MSSSKHSKLMVYIDGFNLYHAIDALNINYLKWLNLQTLARGYVKPGEELVATYFFTAVLKWNPDKTARHKTFIKALRAVGVEVIESNFKKSKRHCRATDRYCDFYEEKQTDVAFAVTLVRDAFLHRFDRAILITADSDQIPAVRLIKETFPEKRLTLVAPPGRLASARDLGNHISDRSELSAGRLATCLLPRDVLSPTGAKIVTMPTAYAR
jgi:uncharacterized LabA/DUF88 family protein